MLGYFAKYLLSIKTSLLSVDDLGEGDEINVVTSDGTAVVAEDGMRTMPMERTTTVCVVIKIFGRTVCRITVTIRSEKVTKEKATKEISE